MRENYLLLLLILFCLGCSIDESSQDKLKIVFDSSTVENSIVKIANSDIKPTRILHITDSHITFAGPEDEEFDEYSSRMSEAYSNGNHYKTGIPISRTEAFTGILQKAKKMEIDLILLTGDILNYPSKRAVQFVIDELNSCGIPYLFTAGNHDWHLEGLSGSSNDLREKWRKDVLFPLYQGENPSHYSQQINGINFLMIDNSTYQMNKEQVDFIRQQSKLGLPMILGLHIPVSIDGQLYGIGNRNWGAAIDKGYELERRERWPEEGHNQETYEFVEILLNTPVSIVLSGHVHTFKNERKGEFLQFVSPIGRYGQYRIIEILPVTID